jgi:ATP-dependent Clp protease ATP-binding subunit ClpB
MNPPAHPKWLRDVLQLLSIRAQFILTGHIRDRVLVGGESAPALVSLKAALWRALEPHGYQGFLVWDMVDGLQAYPPDPARLPRLGEIAGVDLARPQPMRLAALADVLRRVAMPPAASRDGVALIVDYASRLREEGRLPDDVRDFLVAAEKAAIEARPVARPPEDGAKPLFNPVFWLANRPNDLPYWLTVDNERVRPVPVPPPDADTRHRAARVLWPLLPDRDLDADAFARALSGLTHNMSLNALHDIVSLASRQGIAASDIGRAVQSFRVGDLSLESPWRGERLRQAIAEAEARGLIEGRVKGQPKAVQKVLDILKRTSIGLTGAQAGGSASRPRGVLFFVGPTGVGKTEMAKTIAQVVFGDESAYLRFDMSEFSAEHSGDRLIGAPPGYVGFDQGGELTNAMRERPFRVLLFDEIEKAHHRILDKFLQVLEDGRLTDGRGETVYFSEALIVFTSNLGISRELPDGRVEVMVRPSDPPEEFERKLMDGIRDHFHRRLQRPELLNRIGENVVIFNYITEAVARDILAGMIGNIRRRVREEQDIELVLEPAAEAALRRLCAEGDLGNGGRGIGAKLEAVFVNPLARRLFQRVPARGGRLTITEVRESHGGYELIAD